MNRKWISLVLAFLLAFAFTACGKTSEVAAQSTGTNSTVPTSTAQETERSASSSVTADYSSAVDTAELFTSRDLQQSPDLTDAVSYTVSNGEDIEITAAGVYVFSGSASNATIVVDAADDDKVQLVLDGVTITNDDFPCIYVKNADKVFVTTTQTENTLSVTGTFTADGTTNTDAVIFAKDDLVLNGLGTLSISSTDNGISGKDDLKITGGTIKIDSVSCAVEANDSICIADGSITITAQTDGLHAEDDDDDSAGYIFICGGEIDITAKDDGIHAMTIVQIDDGQISVSAGEGIEATWIQINGGTISINASDDGVNAGRKSSAYTCAFEMNSGYLAVAVTSGDTDAIDSNGNLYINGGTVDITAQNAFDCDGTAQYNGGTIIINGVETNAITGQMMGQFGGTGEAPGGMAGNFDGAGTAPNEMGGGPGGEGGPGGMGGAPNNGGGGPGGNGGGPGAMNGGPGGGGGAPNGVG